MFSHQKQAISSEYLAENMSDADDADDLVLLTNTHA